MTNELTPKTPKPASPDTLPAPGSKPKTKPRPPKSDPLDAERRRKGLPDTVDRKINPDGLVQR